MLTIHHLENSRSQRILWLLEELGVEYEIKHYQRDKKTSLAPRELLDVHPLGKSPVITDGDVTVAESGAIVEYLVEHYDDGTLLPAPGWRTSSPGQALDIRSQAGPQATCAFQPVAECLSCAGHGRVRVSSPA